MQAGTFRSALTTSAVVLGLCAFIALLSWGEYANWKVQVARAETSMIQTAEAITQHADDTIEMSWLSLASLISEIRDEWDDPEMPAKIKAVVALQVRASPTLDTLSYLDATGQMVATSVDDPPTKMNYADREYFRFHKSSRFRLPVLGKPIKSRLSQE